MFTGLIERMGMIKGRVQQGPGVVLEVSVGTGYEIAEGDSVAVDGLCLTTTAIGADGFKVDVSSESLARSTLKSVRAGTRVNLERALRLGDRLGGHLVSGHVDAVGRIAERRAQGEFAVVTVAAPREIMALVIEKGSIAVDGISLTVNALQSDRFTMMLIPETLERTTLGWKKTGDEVNLETDLIGKYVARLLGKSTGEHDAELMKKLVENGFI